MKSGLKMGKKHINGNSVGKQLPDMGKNVTKFIKISASH